MKSHIIGPANPPSEIVDEDELEGMEFDEFMDKNDGEKEENS